MTIQEAILELNYGAVITRKQLSDLYIFMCKIHGEIRMSPKNKYDVSVPYVFNRDDLNSDEWEIVN